MNKSRLGLCGVCQIDAAKYTCPACETTTCSLQCSKKHKSEKNCDGIRQKTGFVRLNKLDALHLTSDYRLIEDITRTVATCQRDKIKSSNRIHNQIPAYLHRLKTACLARQAHLLLLPNTFTGRKKNTTMYDYKLKKIFWKLQLTFLNAESFTLYEDKCPEDTVLRTILEKYLTNPEQKPNKKLEVYKHAGLDSLVVLMKAERVSMSGKKFYKLDLNETLKENLVGKTIVEFPKLFVCIEEFITTKKAPQEPAAGQEPKKKLGKSLLVCSDSAIEEPLVGTGLLQEDEDLLKLDTSSSSSSSFDSDHGDDDMEADVPAYQDLIKSRY